MIMLFDRTLHYAPVQEDHSGYMTMIILPKSTNEPLDEGIITSINKEELITDTYLFMKNKWLLAHEESEELIDKGAQMGIRGINYDWSQVAAQSDNV